MVTLDHSHTTSYLHAENNESESWNDFTIQVVNYEERSCGGLSGYYFKTYITLPWGTTITEWFYEGTSFDSGDFYADESFVTDVLSCRTGVTVYDGEFSEAKYSQRFKITCTNVAHFDNYNDNFATYKIEWGVGAVNERFLHPDGTDGNFAGGLNWKYAWGTIDYSAKTIGDGETLYIASGDYIEGTTMPQISPVNLGSIGLIRYYLKDPDNTGTLKARIGTHVESRIYDFSHSTWGSYTRYYYDDGTHEVGHNWINGFSASNCNFISSDVFIGSGELMYIWLDEDEDILTYTGGESGTDQSDQVLEDGWVVRTVTLDANGDKAQIDILHDGVVQNTYYVMAGDDIVHWHTVSGTSFPLLVLHVDAIFSAETNSVWFKGRFHSSDWFVDNTGVST